MKTAWLFPGQASQKVGMGLDLFEKTDLGKSYFNRANEILETDIQSIIFDGPDEILKQTKYTQPAIYIVSVIIGKLLLEKGCLPSALAGHSLGEYSALCIGNAFSFETGLSLVKVRAESMFEAGKNEPGSMAAIVGMDDAQVQDLCDAYQDGIVVPANFNSLGQIVISGEPNAVEDLMKIAKEAGARLVIPLNVSGAFHSPLMKSARESLAEILNSTEISDTIFPIYANVHAGPTTNGSAIRELLLKQLENPVLWSKTMNNLIEDGNEMFLELGPGKVLQGLLKRIDRKQSSRGIGTLEEIENYDV
ncbi:MAG: ACP S-malonyltransferase [Candidatus Marinimicrobia bacterium]|nr:ACP S-malonyltransferase [Candidatus Neomarinimicrobiota bacterium]MBT3496748.1 ACP S-malonyltransferase [Candidatus Neomarinimicrobiota bacterium]MBT3692728.1 ACP S-malonyltransferase [Candidatus Neomarinimicrobiota bacterium]MBT3732882.1 ACP S-malonyltransferase [Candidatus Neomarinimicrobiota bacterium]MBT4144757.1 ACP S-malonyltransferase [Candidatus Neomarinimicrobiota bacterium]